MTRVLRSRPRTLTLSFGRLHNTCAYMPTRLAATTGSKGEKKERRREEGISRDANRILGNEWKFQGHSSGLEKNVLLVLIGIPGATDDRLWHVELTAAIF